MKKLNSKNIALIIEVRSSSVQASIVDVSISHGQNFCSTKILLPNSNKSLVRSMMKALKGVVDTVTRDFELYRQVCSIDDRRNEVGKISSVHFILSSPWILSQAHNVSTTLPKAKKINQKVLNTILDNHDFKPKAHVGGNWVNIERKVMDVCLNGYQKSSWVNQTARTVEIFCLASVASSDVIREFEKIVEHIVPKRDINYHSALVLQYIAGTQISSHNSAQVCINIHDDITDIISVSKQHGIYFGSFPIGHRTVSKRLSSALNIGERGAVSLLSMHSDSNLDTIHSRFEIKTIENILANWKNEYTEFLKLSLPNIPNIPTHTFIFSDLHPNLIGRLVRSRNSQSHVDIMSNSTFVDTIHTII